MANQKHLDILKKGVDAWNKWRKEYPDIQPNLSGADLSRTNLSGANLSDADLTNANLSSTDLTGADLSGANLSDADLTNANLSSTDLSRANLSRANLSRAILVSTNLNNVMLKNCNIYGIAAWDVQLEGAAQYNLVITPENKPTITVDNLKIAQLIYLLLNNVEIRDVINTLSTKSVLILGQFTPERKRVLDALRDALRKHNYLPILFDFNPENTQTVRETVRTLAHLSRFIIADFTNASVIQEELETIIPTLAVPVQPLIISPQKREFSMFKGMGVYPWVLKPFHYNNADDLLSSLEEKVIKPAEEKAKELEKIIKG